MDSYYQPRSFAKIESILSALPPQDLLVDGLYYCQLEPDEEMVDIRALWQERQEKGELVDSGLPSDMNNLVLDRVGKTEIEVKHYLQMASVKWESPIGRLHELSKALDNNLTLLDELAKTIRGVKSHCKLIAEQVNAIVKELGEPGDEPLVCPNP